MSDSCSWSPKQRDAMRAWIEAHRASLPRTLEELARFPMFFRRMIARALPLDQRVAVWREHLETVYSLSRSGSPDQRALLADVIEQLPALLSGDVERAEASMRSLEPRMRVLLSREQLLEALATLGPPEPPEGLPFPPEDHRAAAG